MIRLFIAIALLCCLYVQPLRAHPGAHASIQHFNQLIEQQPDDHTLYVQRGIALSNDGQYEAALADFRRAEELGDPVMVAFDLGVLHYRMEKFDQAKRYFDTYLEKYPNHAACLEYRARLLRDAGDFGASVADFQRVFELLERPNPGHYVSVAEMISARGETGIAPALSILDSGNAKLGVTPQLQHYAIGLELRRGRPDLAIARQVTLEPTLGQSPDWKVDMAELLLENGDKAESLRLLKIASEQLDELRKTPARLALRDRIETLQDVE